MIKKSFRLVFISLLLGSGPLISVIAWCQSDPLVWTGDRATLLFYEALVKTKKNALNPEPFFRVVQKSLRAYLRQIDGFSDYLPAHEYDAYKKTQNYQYGGVGMDIWSDIDGRFICVPFPDGPAALSGIRYGDQLYKIDGQDVSGRSVFFVGSMIRGKPGTVVAITVKSVDSKIKIFKVKRVQIIFKSVLLQRLGSLSVVRILRFTDRTPQELKNVFLRIEPERVKIIDLRGNTGGDLFSAVDSASLFLKADSKIMDLKTNSGLRPYIARGLPMDSDSVLYLWQDKYSASAAEVLIAALTQNGRAISIGTKTFGKGLVQKIVELTDGSAMFLTYASIVTPKGMTFHETGLEPTCSIKPNFPEPDKSYLDMVDKLLKSTEDGLKVQMRFEY